MALPVETYISRKLDEKKRAHNFRCLTLIKSSVDFTSNDYLGLARDITLKNEIIREFEADETLRNGSTGSRLLSGNSSHAEELEKEIARFHNAEAALLMNSGFDANYGLLSSLPYRGDTVLYDEAVHASIHDGMRRSKARCIPFRHNSPDDLASKLSEAEGLSYVVVESLYSMEGDFAPLEKIADLCAHHRAALIVDEAHATGLFGQQGSGRVCELGLERACFARIVTYGKAAGVAGAAVLGSASLKEFMLNYCRPLIFSTAMMPYQLVSIRCAYRAMAKADQARSRLFSIISYYRESMRKAGLPLPADPKSPIQIIPVHGNEKALALAAYLQQQDLDVRAIRYPTVSAGNERLRICLHSFNEAKQIDELVKHLQIFFHA
ncbi:MAG: aminotransferase class I/II-fold pyridoxal phosphate-dependent enzyme [Chitinophagales bacterium]|nr:aminotransferase class I/II-fold pyridoxal phosphate-dependent enzyme [Chitinophagales bacterium]MDW8419345.1 aminotransferase class I/II-fold pyridoxal phosphate-dependent enzyme [Chitinophagales bacterium]